MGGTGKFGQPTIGFGMFLKRGQQMPNVEGLRKGGKNAIASMCWYLS